MNLLTLHLGEESVDSLTQILKYTIETIYRDTLFWVGNANSCASLTAPLLSVAYTLNTASPDFSRFLPAIVAV